MHLLEYHKVRLNLKSLIGSLEKLIKMREVPDLANLMIIFVCLNS